MNTFFSRIYRDAPKDGLVAWGNLYQPLYFTVEDLLKGEPVIQQDIDQYFTPAILSHPKRDKKNVIGASVCWVDIDGYKADLSDPLIPASIYVSSGKGTHAYWLLDKFYPAKEIEAANKALAEHIGIRQKTHEGTHNANRLLRIPGSFNNKYKNPEKYPTYTEPIPCVIEMSTNVRYSLTDLKSLKPYDKKLVEVPSKNEGAESSRDFRVGMTLLRWGVSLWGIEQYLRTYSSKAQSREKDDGSNDYIELTISNLTAKFKEEGAKAPFVGEEEDLSTVRFTPMARVFDHNGREEGILVQLSWGQSIIKALATALDFSTKTKINAWLGKVAPSRIFGGTDKKAVGLWNWLESNTPNEPMLHVQHSGRYDLPDKTIFIYDEAHALSTEEGEPLVHWESRIPDQRGLSLQAGPLNAGEMKRTIDLLLASQPLDISQPALGWLVMSLFKPVIETIGYEFPLLFAFGIKGSGKSSYIRKALLPVIGLHTSAISSELTHFALIGYLQQSRSIPTWLGEFRNENYNSGPLQMLLRSTYDSSGIARGNADKTISFFELTSPVIIDGEDVFGDSANLERTINLHFLKPTVAHNTSYAQAFNELCDIPDSVRNNQAYHLINWTLRKGPSYIKALVDPAVRRFNQDVHETRAAKAGAIAWAGIHVLQDFFADFRIDFNLNPQYDLFVQAVTSTHAGELGTPMHADRFLARLTQSLDTGLVPYTYDPDTDTLWFILEQAHARLKERTRPAMLKQQMKNRVGQYLVGPRRMPNGAWYWGIELTKAQELSGPDLNFMRPDAATVVSRVVTNGKGLNHYE